MATIELLRRFWKPLAVLLLLLMAYLKGAGDKDAQWQIMWNARDTRDAMVALHSVEAARKREQELLAAWDAANSIQFGELQNVHSHRDRLLADLRAGRLRLQACPAAKVPAVAADSGESQAGAEGGQPGLVGEELVSRLATCDEVTLERNQAVRLLEAERR